MVQQCLVKKTRFNWQGLNSDNIIIRVDIWPQLQPVLSYKEKSGNKLSKEWTSKISWYNLVFGLNCSCNALMMFENPIEEQCYLRT